MASNLCYGTLGARPVHLRIDMQDLFAEPTEWQVPWMPRVLPAVARMARSHPCNAIFTRFIPPPTPEDAPGAWRRYFRRWRQMTHERIGPKLFELVPPLAALVPPAQVVDKARLGYPFNRT